MVGVRVPCNNVGIIELINLWFCIVQGRYSFVDVVFCGLEISCHQPNHGAKKSSVTKLFFSCLSFTCRQKL